MNAAENPKEVPWRRGERRIWIFRHGLQIRHDGFGTGRRMMDAQNGIAS
jgi:hypothetical protein